MNAARGRRSIESVTHGGSVGDVMAWDDELDHLDDVGR